MTADKCNLQARIKELESPVLPQDAERVIAHLGDIENYITAEERHHYADLIERLAARIKELEGDNKELAIKLGATEVSFTDFRGSVAGKTCMLCNFRERADCYAEHEQLEARIKELEGSKEDPWRYWRDKCVKLQARNVELTSATAALWLKVDELELITDLKPDQPPQESKK